MKNRPRPPIPFPVKLEVSGWQLFRHETTAPIFFAEFSRREGETLAALLERRLVALAKAIGCERKDLRLDHEPALRVRKFSERRYRATMKAFKAGEITSRQRWPRIAACYDPDANDPDAMAYRPQAAEHERSHHIKTNVRGDHGQFPDKTLIKRERKRERKAAGVRHIQRSGRFGQKIKARPVRFQRPKPHARVQARVNRWPPKGSRPLRGRTDERR